MCIVYDIGRGKRGLKKKKKIAKYGKNTRSMQHSLVYLAIGCIKTNVTVCERVKQIK